MAEDRNMYTIKEDGDIGTVKVADEVVAIIAGLVATEVRGVAHLAGNITNDMVARVGVNKLSRSVRVEVLENMVTIDLALEVDLGCSIPEVSLQVQEKVKNAVENMTGMKVTDVNIQIAGVKMSEE